MAIFRLIFIFTESTCLRFLAHQIWSLYLLPVKSYVGVGWGGGGLFCPPTKMVLLNSPTTIGLRNSGFYFSKDEHGIIECKIKYFCDKSVTWGLLLLN